ASSPPEQTADHTPTDARPSPASRRPCASALSTFDYDPAEMRLLFDIAHPVHAHVLRHVILRFAGAGHECRVVSRDKDVTGRLLDHWGIPNQVPTTVGRGRLGLLRELVARERAFWAIAREFRPRLIVGTSAHAARVGRLVGARSVVVND